MSDRWLSAVKRCLNYIKSHVRNKIIHSLLWTTILGQSWSYLKTIFTRDIINRENHWQITSLVAQKSLFTVTHTYPLYHDHYLEFYDYIPNISETRVINAVRCRYNTVNFLDNSHNEHPISRPLGRDMGCLWRETILILKYSTHCSVITNILLNWTVL